MGTLLFVNSVVFLVALWWLFFTNRFFIEPNKRERLVVQNVLIGSARVLGPGTHFRPIWVKQLERVDLNREDIVINDDQFRTADGALITLNYRYDIIAGRDFDKDDEKTGHRGTGQLKNPDTKEIDNVRDPQTGRVGRVNPDDQAMVTDEAVIWAVTRIDFKNREKRVEEIVRGAVEEELGLYSLKELVSPSSFVNPRTQARGVTIHELQIEGTPLFAEEVVTTSSQLYEGLSRRIMARGNKRLTFVGLNIIAVQITNLKPSAGTQESVEKPLRADYEADAAEQTLKRARDKNERLSYGEALVAENPAAFAEATKAEAIRDGAAAIRDGMRNWGKGQS